MQLGKRKADTYYQRRKMRLGVLTRILKSDIRRIYPLMYCNIMSTMNPKLIKGFLSQYGRHTIHLVDFVPHALFGVPATTAHGIEASTALMSNVCVNMPDAIGSLLDSTIVRTPGEQTSSVVLNVRFQATFLPDASTEGAGERAVDFVINITFHLSDTHHIQRIVFTPAQAPRLIA